MYLLLTFFSLPSVESNHLEFVLFVIDENSPVHASIKYVCDVALGVSSKCVKSQTIGKVLGNNRGPDQVLLNILYGLNPKFDGENVVGFNTEFAFKMLTATPTLIIGKSSMFFFSQDSVEQSLLLKLAS